MDEKVITRHQVRETRAVKRRKVPVPEFGEGVVVYVYGMTARERSQFEMRVQGADRVKIREQLIIATARDANGAPVFEPSDADFIGNQPAEALEPIVDAAQELCGMTGKDLDDIAGNSDATTLDS